MNLIPEEKMERLKDTPSLKAVAAMMGTGDETWARHGAVRYAEASSDTETINVGGHVWCGGDDLWAFVGLRVTPALSCAMIHASDSPRGLALQIAESINEELDEADMAWRVGEVILSACHKPDPAWAQDAFDVTNHPNFPGPIPVTPANLKGGRLQILDLEHPDAHEWLGHAINSHPRTIRFVLSGEGPDIGPDGRWSASLDTCSSLSFFNSEYGLGHVLAQVLLHLWDGNSASDDEEDAS